MHNHKRDNRCRLCPVHTLYKGLRALNHRFFGLRLDQLGNSHQDVRSYRSSWREASTCTCYRAVYDEGTSREYMLHILSPTNKLYEMFNAQILGSEYKKVMLCGIGESSLNVWGHH